MRKLSTSQPKNGQETRTLLSKGKADVFQTHEKNS